VQSFNYITDDRHAALADDLVNTPSRTGRGAVLRLAGLGHDAELLDALDRAEVDHDSIVIALADSGGVLPVRMAVEVIQDQERDRRIELARAS